MKTILLVPLRDYYQSRKRIWVKYLIPVVLGLLALAGALIFNIGNEETIRSTFSEFVNVQINVVAILVSFSVAIISILVTADNANTKSLKEEMADSTQYKPVGGKQLSLFQILLSNIAYNYLLSYSHRNCSHTANYSFTGIEICCCSMHLCHYAYSWGVA